MKKITQKQLKWAILGIIIISLIIFLMVTILKYRMPSNTLAKINLPYEEGRLIDHNSMVAVERESYEVVTPSNQNNFTKMNIDLNTTNITITQGGQTYQTLPYHIYGENITSQAASPLTITYFYKGRNTPVPINAFDGSIKGGYYEVYQLENGVRVVYEIGVREIKSSWIPGAILQAEYFEIFDNANEEEKQALRSSYSSAGDDLVMTLNATVSQDNLQILYDLWWNKLGLTLEELADRAKQLTGQPSFVEMPLFKIPVDYRIDENGHFTVEVLNDKIEENGPDLGEKTLKIKNISLLENFILMETKNANEHDFLFIPDGSGAIVKPYYLDQTAQYYKPFYDNDIYFKKNQESVDLSKTITLNAYGYAYGQKGVLAIVESGAGVARLNMPMITSTARVSTDFDLRIDDEYEFVQGVKINQFDDIITDERIKTKYILFQTDNYLTYYDMVLSLQENYLSDLTKNETYNPIEVEIVGAIKERKHFVGIPYFKTVSLTKYSEVLAIYNSFDNLNITYKYSGFSNGGVNGLRQTTLKHDNSLGSRQDFNQLIDDIPNLYYDIYVINKYLDKDGSFKNANHGLREIGGHPNTYYDNSRMTLTSKQNELFKHYILDPNYLEHELDSIINSTQKLPNLSMRDLGNTFVSNYTLNPLNFENVSHVMANGFNKLQDSHRLMLSNPFLPFAKYATTIEDLPITSSGHVSFYSDIPFLQLLYSPYINTYSEAVNLGASVNEVLLKALLSQSGLKYVLSYDDSKITKTNPYYNKYYATNYLKHTSEINDIYHELNNFYTLNNEIQKHELLSPNIYLITYSNGSKYIFNLSNHSYNYQAQNINNKSYLKVN